MSHEAVSGIWKIFEILRAGLMLLFVYNRSQEIFGNAQETFLFTVEKKTNTGVYVRNNLRQWKK